MVLVVLLLLLLLVVVVLFFVVVGFKFAHQLTTCCKPSVFHLLSSSVTVLLASSLFCLIGILRVVRWFCSGLIEYVRSELDIRPAVHAQFIEPLDRLN